MEINIDSDPGGYLVTMKNGLRVIRQEWVSRESEAEYLVQKWSHGEKGAIDESEPIYDWERAGNNYERGIDRRFE